MVLELATANDLRHPFLVSNNGAPVGLVDVELYGGGRTAFACVTAPEHRRRGYAAAAIRALPSVPVLRATHEFFAGVEEQNMASERLLLGIGFIRVTETDEDGFRYFAWTRPGHHSAQPWQLTD